MGGDPRDPLADCVHVGFCLPACPTYLLWAEEMDSPRGRITLMEVAREETISPEMVLHWDRCLGCMACVTACPAGVRYDRLLGAIRAQVEQQHRRPLAERLFRRLLVALVTHPRRLARLLPLVRAAALLRPMLRVLLRPFPHLAVLVRLARPPAAAEPLPPLTPARGARRGRVGLLRGCVQRVMFPQVNLATVGVLALEGFEVVAPDLPRCCGALHLHAGYEEEARDLARSAIEALEGCDLVAVNAAGCGAAMKEYGHLLADDPLWAARAEAFSTRVRDASELLAETGLVGKRSTVSMRVAYHDPCHLAHAQGVVRQPRELLRAIPGLEVVEVAEGDVCCGSAGVYNLLQPAAAAELGLRKARHLLETGAEAVVSANPGCSLQIAAHLEEAGRPMAIYHPVELLWRSIRGG